MIIALIGVSTPVFWLGQMANLISQGGLHNTVLFSWVPRSGTPRSPPPGALVRGPGAALDHAVDPVHRVLRPGTAGQRARGAERGLRPHRAQAKGLTERRVLMRHTLRNSMITFVSLFGLDFGALVGGGAILTEVVFGIHGVGFLTYQALTNLDLPTIMATVVYGAFFIVLANALVDVAYAGSTRECGPPDERCAA